MALTRVCLDTSAYSHFKRGDANVRRIIVAAREVVVPSVVLGELHTGFRLGGRRDENEAELAAFLAEPVVEVAAVDDETASVYADIVCDLRRIGRPLPTNDIWIAAVAARTGTTVVTYDDHFLAVARVASRVLPVA